jgi:hypothetical protein
MKELRGLKESAKERSLASGTGGGRRLGRAPATPRKRYYVEPIDNLGTLDPPPPRDRTWIVRDRETGFQHSEFDRRADARAEADRLNAEKESS